MKAKWAYGSSRKPASAWSPGELWSMSGTRSRSFLPFVPSPISHWPWTMKEGKSPLVWSVLASAGLHPTTIVILKPNCCIRIRCLAESATQWLPVQMLTAARPGLIVDNAAVFSMPASSLGQRSSQRAVLCRALPECQLTPVSSAERAETFFPHRGLRNAIQTYGWKNWFGSRTLKKITCIFLFIYF